MTARRTVARGLQVLLVAATVVFVALALARSWGEVTAYDWTFRPEWLAVSAAVLFAFYCAQAMGWWLLLAGFGLRPGVLTTWAVWGSSILARYVPGTVFMFVGRAWLHHGQGLDLPRVGAAMVYEQALQLSAALVTVALLWPFARVDAAWAAWSLLAIPPLLALTHPRVFVPLAGRALRLLHRAPSLLERDSRRRSSSASWSARSWAASRSPPCWALRGSPACSGTTSRLGCWSGPAPGASPGVPSAQTPTPWPS